MRDYQASRVYRWERNHLPSGPDVRIEHAQALVDHIWENEGLKYPPRVEPIAANTTKYAGKANRFNIWLQPVVSTKTIIHEVAHSMTSDIYGNSAWHSSLFVGMYCRLLEKYMQVDRFHMLATLGMEGVDIDITASPIFLD